MSANDWSVKYRQVQQGALSLYVSTLDGALAPLEERYRRALGDLVDIQQTYAQELGRRLSAVYVSYAETVAAIPAGTSDLEAAAEAYRTLVEKYGQFVDPVYWGSEIAPAQQKLKQAVAQAVGNDDAKRLTQDALEVFYRDLSDLLGENGSAKGLSDAQLRYAGHVQQLQLEIGKAWQQAAKVLNEGLSDALAGTGKAFDLNTAMRSFADALKGIEEEVVRAYGEAAEKATRFWHENWSDQDTTEALGRASGFAFGAATAGEPPLATVSGSAYEAPYASRPPTAAMSVSPATMPRASWVNIPELPVDNVVESAVPDPQISSAKEQGTEPDSGAEAKAAEGGAKSKSASGSPSSSLVRSTRRGSEGKTVGTAGEGKNT